MVETWKRVLNLEWLRYQLRQKTDKINELQIIWLQNEEKRQKKIYEETAPVNTNPLSSEPKPHKVVSKALQGNEEEKEIMPSSSAGASKKGRAERLRNWGHMGSPAVSVSKLHQVRRVGEQVHTALHTTQGTRSRHQRRRKRCQAQ